MRSLKKTHPLIDIRRNLLSYKSLAVLRIIS